MIWFRNLAELQTIANDPDLWRELFGYMSVCRAEYLETEDDADLLEHDFAFAIATAQDLKALRENGRPEELVIIDIQSGSTVRRIVRLVYPAAVIFIDADPGDDPASLFRR